MFRVRCKRSKLLAFHHSGMLVATEQQGNLHGRRRPGIHGATNIPKKWITGFAFSAHQTTSFRIPATQYAQVIANGNPRQQRAQGMPGTSNVPAALRAKIKARKQVATGSPDQPAFPAQWF
jgi:hypothetical protein